MAKFTKGGMGTTGASLTTNTKKAVEKPIGPLEQAREESPIGWDFGPEGQPPARSDAGEGGSGATPVESDQFGSPQKGASAESDGGINSDHASSGSDGDDAVHAGGSGNSDPVSARLRSESPDGIPVSLADPIGGGNAMPPHPPAGPAPPDLPQGGAADDGDPTDSGNGEDTRPPGHYPPLAGGDDLGSVTEDELLEATGRLVAMSPNGGAMTWSMVSQPEGQFGSFGIDPATGAWTYTLDNDAAQSLRVDQTIQEIFTVRATDQTGASVDHQVTMTILGTNDAPVIGGTAAGMVTEDEAPTVSGQLTTSDVDTGDTATWLVVSGGNHGTLSLDTDGAWTYALDNPDSTAIQGLRADQTVQDVFTIRVTDQAGASVQYQVAVTIAGTNDAPVISGTATGSVVEDESATVSGHLTVKDADIGDTATWSLVGGGSYGTLSVGEDGGWTYTLTDPDNATIQGLGTDERVQEIFTVRVTDAAGAAVDQQVTVTIIGTNDEPVISGTATGTIAEDQASSVSGQLTVTDADIGDTATWSVVGGGSYGTLAIGQDGGWTYTLDDPAGTAIQGLGADERVQEIFTVRATDEAGAEVDHRVTVTIIGTNDAPVIGGTATGSVVEDESATVSGQLTVKDADIGDTATWSVVGGGSYGTLSVDQDGGWTYTLTNPDNAAIQGLGANETVQEVFTVRATDQADADVNRQVTVTIVGTNDAPVIGGAATGIVTEDQAPSISGQLTVSDADIGDTASWSVVGGGSYGTLTVGQDGSWTYTLDDADSAVIQGLSADETAQDVFSVRVTDKSGDTDERQVTVTIVGTNDAPVIGGAATGSVVEDESATVSGQLTVKDADIGDTVTWDVVGGGSYGTLSVDQDGGWTYTLTNPDNAAIQGLGTDERVQEIFTLRATDEAGAEVDHRVTVTIIGTNDEPVISGTATGTITEDQASSVSGELTVTDADIGDTAIWSVVGGGSYGTLTVGQDGGWTYTLDDPADTAIQGLSANETVQEIFTVRATDEAGAGGGHRGTVTIIGTNDAPMIGGTATGSVVEDESATVSGQLTVSDADIGDTATWNVVDGGLGGYGTLAVDQDGGWTYELDDPDSPALQGLREGETAQEVFTIRVTDQAGATADRQVTVTIIGTNDVPVISGTATGTITEDESATVSGELTVTDPDVGEAVVWSILGGGAGGYGTLVLGQDGDWSYTLADPQSTAIQGLNAGATIQEMFIVRATDQAGATASHEVIVTIVGTNDVPVITGTATGRVTEDQSLTVSGQLVARDADIGDTANWSVVGGGGHGTLTIGQDGSWTYTLTDPDSAAIQGLKADQTMQDIFTVRATDETGAPVDERVTVTIVGTNDKPVIGGTATGTITEDQAPSVSGQLTVTDADIGDTVTWSLVGGGSYGTLAIGQDGGWTYTLDDADSSAIHGLNVNETVQEIITVRAIDETGAEVEQQVTVTILGTNDAPVIGGTSTGTVMEDQSSTASGQLSVSDADIGDTASWSVLGGGNYGTLSIDQDGEWLYTLDDASVQGLGADEKVQDVFTVRVTDLAGATVDHQVAVTIVGTNDDPLIGGTATGTVTEDESQKVSGQLSATDVDIGDTVAWSVVGAGVGGYGTLTIGQGGGWAYTLTNPDSPDVQGLKAGETAEDVFTILATDKAGAEVEHQVTVTIVGTNDTPVISGTESGSVVEDEAPIVSGQLVATDADIGDTASWSVIEDAGSYGTLAVGKDGSWTYTLDNDAAQSLKDGEVVHETFTVRVVDSAGSHADQLVTIDITGTNDVPVVGQSLNSMGAMKEDTSFTFTVDDLLKGAQVTDIDRDTLQVTNVALDRSGAPGTLVDNKDGTWTYTPDKNISNANSQITFSVSDGHESVNAHATVAIQPVADPADVEITSGTLREVINTGPAADVGRIVVPELTKSSLSEFTLEFTVVGKGVPEVGAGEGPVIINIGSASPSDKNLLTLWDPANMKVGTSNLSTGKDTNVATGVDLGDGNSHRITLTWDNVSNGLKVYDNGNLVLTTPFHATSALPEVLYLAIANKANTPPSAANPDGGDYRPTQHYEGTIFNVAVADKAETADQVKTAPLAEQLRDDLLIDVRAQDQQIVDTAGNHNLSAVGGLHQDELPVDSSLASVPAGATLQLDITTQLTDPQDTVTRLEVAGFLPGTVVSDGVHSVTVEGSTEKVDVTDWSLGGLTAKLPDGVHENMELAVSVTVATPPYATGEVDGNGQPILTSDTVTTTADHPIYVEWTPAADSSDEADLPLPVTGPTEGDTSTSGEEGTIIGDPNAGTSTSDGGGNGDTDKDTNQTSSDQQISVPEPGDSSGDSSGDLAASAPILIVSIGAGIVIGGAVTDNPGAGAGTGADTNLGLDIVVTEPSTYQQTGTSTGDAISGGAGDDTIDGGAGDDTLRGDQDYETGDYGNDTIKGGDGNDQITGGDGSDQISGGAGDDRIEADFQWDTANAGNDVVDAGAGNDTVIGGRGDDSIAGGSGNDTIDADFDWETAGGNDRVRAGEGNDTVVGGAGNDVIEGDEGNDTLYGDYRWNTGRDGNDILSGGKGDDVIHGGGGSDIAVYAGLRSQYLITPNSDGSYTVADLVSDRDGTDSVYDIETFRFADGDIVAADLLSNTGGGVSASSGILYPVNITAIPTDADGSETLSDITINMADVPAGTIFSAGSRVGNNWVLSPAQLGGLTMTVPAGAPAFNLDVSVTSTEYANGDAKTTIVSASVDTTDQDAIANSDMASTGMAQDAVFETLLFRSLPEIETGLDQGAATSAADSGHADLAQQVSQNQPASEQQTGAPDLSHGTNGIDNGDAHGITADHEAFASLDPIPPTEETIGLDHHDSMASAADSSHADLNQDMSQIQAGSALQTTASESGDSELSNSGSSDSGLGDFGTADSSIAAQGIGPDRLEALTTDAPQPYHDLAVQFQAISDEPTSPQTEHSSESDLMEQAPVTHASGDGAAGDHGAITGQSAADEYMALAQPQDADHIQPVDHIGDQESTAADYIQMAANTPTESDYQPPLPPDQVLADIASHPGADNAPEPPVQNDDAIDTSAPVIDQPNSSDHEHHGM